MHRREPGQRQDRSLAKDGRYGPYVTEARPGAGGDAADVAARSRDGAPRSTRQTARWSTETSTEKPKKKPAKKKAGRAQAAHGIPVQEHGSRDHRPRHRAQAARPAARGRARPRDRRRDHRAERPVRPVPEEGRRHAGRSPARSRSSTSSCPRRSSSSPSPSTGPRGRPARSRSSTPTRSAASRSRCKDGRFGAYVTDGDDERDDPAGRRGRGHRLRARRSAARRQAREGPREAEGQAGAGEARPRQETLSVSANDHRRALPHLRGRRRVGQVDAVGTARGWLIEQGRTVCRTREPGGTELGDEIREIVLHRRGNIAPRAEALLYAADRAHHMRHGRAPGARARRHRAAGPLPRLVRRLPGSRSRARGRRDPQPLALGGRGAAARPHGPARPRRGDRARPARRVAHAVRPARGRGSRVPRARCARPTWRSPRPSPSASWCSTRRSRSTRTRGRSIRPSASVSAALA